MYDLFERRSPIQYARAVFSEFDLLRRNYQREITKICTYYQERTFSLPNDHVLVRLLEQLSIPIQYSIEHCIELAQARAAYSTASMQFTSEIRTGRWFTGVFYGDDSNELLLQIETYINPATIEADWQTIAPIRVLWHSQSNLGLFPPIGRRLASDAELAVVAIDAALLAVQYRCYCLHQQRNAQQGGEVIASVPTFLRRFVLPNMIAQQLDLALINRLINLERGAPMGTTYARLPFSVYHAEQAIDAVLQKWLSVFYNRGLKYEAVLRNIPIISATDAQAALTLPDVALTRQIYWALVFSRLTVCQFLIKLGGEKGRRQNQMELNKFRRILRLLVNERCFETRVPTAMQYDVQRLIDSFFD